MREFMMVTGVVMCVYWWTLFPSIPGGDAGEIAAEACQLGTAHPPGYPLFTLLNHAVARLPIPRLGTWGDGGGGNEAEEEGLAAYRMNLLSATLGALAAGLIGCTATTLLDIHTTSNTKQHGVHGKQFPMAAACTSGFLFAFSPHVWEYSLGTEVFALNNFFCALITFMVLQAYVAYERVRASGSAAARCALQWQGLAGALVAGLSMANQHTSLLLLIAAVPFVLLLLIDARCFSNPSTELSHKQFSRNDMFFYLIASALVGLGPYAYLYLASSHPTRGSWGDMTSLTGFVRHVARAEYGTFRLGASTHGQHGDWVQRIGFYLSHASHESGHLVFPLCAATVWTLITDRSQGVRGAVRTVRPDSSDSDADYKTSLGLVGKNASRTVLSFVIGAWVLYTLVWHCVLSNLPLSAPTPYGVHARFWMQPSALVSVLAGVGTSVLLCALTSSSSTSAATPHTSSPIRGGGGSGRGGGGGGGDKSGKSRKPTGTKSSSPTTTTLGTTSRISHSTHTLLDWAVAGALLSVLLYGRLEEADRSSAGWTLHKYAAAVLDSVPTNGVLLSHTDLDWNPVRYLRQCQNMRPDITHLSLQMMPYPWFIVRQAPLYPNISFVESFNGISTDRYSEGNAILIHSFVRQNQKFVAMDVLDPISSEGASDTNGGGGGGGADRMDRTNTDRAGGIYLDMQAVNDAEVESGNQWRGLTLVPWGTHYRVMPGTRVQDTASFHSGAAREMARLDAAVPAMSDEFLFRFHPSSWEWGARAMVHDAQYQLGLFMLTYAIDAMGDISLPALPYILDRLLHASTLLEGVTAIVVRSEIFTRTHPYALPGPVGAVTGQGSWPITVSANSLYKNNALAWMRLQHVLPVCMKFRGAMLQLISDNEAAEPGTLTPLVDVVHLRRALEEPSHTLELLLRAHVAMTGFATFAPDDADTPKFIMAVEKLQEVIKAGSAQWDAPPDVTPSQRGDGVGREK
jgi:hypothetical protein